VHPHASALLAALGVFAAGEGEIPRSAAQSLARVRTTRLALEDVFGQDEQTTSASIRRIGAERCAHHFKKAAEAASVLADAVLDPYASRTARQLSEDLAAISMSMFAAVAGRGTAER